MGRTPQRQQARVLRMQSFICGGIMDYLGKVEAETAILELIQNPKTPTIQEFILMSKGILTQTNPEDMSYLVGLVAGIKMARYNVNYKL
jgi:hypothetical protein